MWSVSRLCSICATPLACRPPAAAGCPHSSSRNLKCCQCCHQFVCLLFEPWSCYYFGYGCSTTEKRGASQGACQVAAWPSVAFVLCPVSLVYPALPCPVLAATTVNSRLGSVCLVALFTFAAPAHWRHKQLYHGARGCKQVAAAHCATQHVVLATRRTQQTVAAAGGEEGVRIVWDLSIGAGHAHCGRRRCCWCCWLTYRRKLLLM